MKVIKRDGRLQSFDLEKIQTSILNGDDVTGVTTMYMSEGLDTGDIIDYVETSIGENETAGQLLDRLAREYYNDELGSFAYAQGLLTQFMVELNRLAQYSGPVQKWEEPDLVTQVLAYIGNHYQENITLESLASEFFVSKYHLSHEFSHRVGTSVYRYVIFRRLLQARDLMTAGVNPGQVYQICGFGDYANFYRAFKAEYGISPREFVQGK